ncbi:MAG: acyl-CoA dehydrogenase family protein [Deltaproteobacteria bacterium]|nr:acyl-CoA dehydrogenase family protein [Deltaproteobacteria bacterium]MBW2009512.1 acyl-CoA dehydrogenase family protein [Deltaproteobacteria bacterium]MBW2101055.1 acyl-CoA dehydrogenase family protein [Deltaproteobacteria bacterium]
MDLLYSEEEEEFRKEVRQLVDEELRPVSRLIEREERSPREFLRKLGQRGYLGVVYPEELGGSNRGIVYDTIVSEEISYVCPAADAMRGVSTLFCGAPLYRFGTTEQKEKYLRPTITGEALGAIGISEPSAGSDAAGMKTRARKEGDYYIINGQKHWITNGSEADHLLLFAITNPQVHSHKGMSAFIVETSTEGFEVVRDLPAMGLRGGRHSHLRFTDMKIPASNLLGEENNGFHVLTDELASERIDICSRTLGCARRLYEESLKHSAKREQFGRKIRSFEGVSFKIAEMKVDLDAARLLMLRAARMYDEGLPVVKEAAIAKLFVVERAFRIADKALQIHGALGYSKDHVIEQFFRDIRVFRLGGGTDEIMKYLIQREEYRDFGLS